jgi:hypothetical protein
LIKAPFLLLHITWYQLNGLNYKVENMVISSIKRWWNERKELLKEERRRAEERSNLRLWAFHHETKTMEEVHLMTGQEFEEFLARLLQEMGYKQVRLTASNDQGADVLCVAPEGARVAVQAKCWKGSVGNSAVQQVLGAINHYSCDQGMVITNSTFTEAAKRLASSCENVELCDGSWLNDAINRYFPKRVPPFDRVQFDALIEGLILVSREAVPELRTKPPYGEPDFRSLNELIGYWAQRMGTTLSASQVKRIFHLFVTERQSNSRASIPRNRYRRSRMSTRWLR